MTMSLVFTIMHILAAWGRRGGVLPIMDYIGMLCPKGVPFWAPGMGKGSLFRLEVCEWGTLPGKGMCKGVPFQRNVCERGANFRNLVWERAPIFPNLVCERVRGLDLGRSIPVQNWLGYPPPPLGISRLWRDSFSCLNSLTSFFFSFSCHNSPS